MNLEAQLHEGEQTLARSGLLSAAFGVIIFSHPGAGALALLGLVAAFAFVTGVMQRSRSRSSCGASSPNSTVASGRTRRRSLWRTPNRREESEMQTMDPHLVVVAAALSAAVLMVHAGIAKRQLAWRTRRTNRARRRRR